MRFHGDRIMTGDIYKAAQAAGVTVVRAGMHNSRTRNRAFDIALEGDSRRRPMGGPSGVGSGYAATWDQWGIFIDSLFMADDTLTIPRVYENRGDFDFRTVYRFEDAEAPADMHGDHTFRYSGTPCTQECTKCSAQTRWN